MREVASGELLMGESGHRRTVMMLIEHRQGPKSFEHRHRHCLHHDKIVMQLLTIFKTAINQAAK